MELLKFPGAGCAGPGLAGWRLRCCGCNGGSWGATRPPTHAHHHPAAPPVASLPRPAGNIPEAEVPCSELSARCPARGKEQGRPLSPATCVRLVVICSGDRVPPRRGLLGAHWFVQNRMDLGAQLPAMGEEDGGPLPVGAELATPSPVPPVTRIDFVLYQWVTQTKFSAGNIPGWSQSWGAGYLDLREWWIPQPH